MLTGVCPGCGLRADLDVFALQADTNAALAAALALPAPLGGRILRYLRLFSPPSKTLALGKATRLLVELAETIGSTQVSRRGIVHVAPLALWEAALDAVLAQPPEALPLSGHGYLLQVAWNLAERAAARGERQAEDRLRRGQRPAESSAPEPPLSGAASAPPAPALAGEAAFSSPATAPRRVGPPPEFRALVKQMTGKSLPPPTPTQTAEE